MLAVATFAPAPARAATEVNIVPIAGGDSVIKLIADHGADPHAKDERGRTPLDVAKGVGVRGRAGGPPEVRQTAIDLLEGYMAAHPAPEDTTATSEPGVEQPQDDTPSGAAR